MKVLVTGSGGFIGKNLCERLSRVENVEIIRFERENKIEELEEVIGEVKFIYNLAGINRPENPEEFYTGNKGFAEDLTGLIERKRLAIPMLITSSIQAEKDNDYGKSKLGGEIALKEYSKKTGAKIFIYRLANAFGKWCRPNYNSVVATWCYNMANDLPIQVNSREALVDFVYIDDVVNSFAKCLKGIELTDKTGQIEKAQKTDEIKIVELVESEEKKDEKEYCEITPIYSVSLGELSDLLNEFKENRKNLSIPKVGKGFPRALYATYLSYLPKDKFSYELTEHSDVRGSFVEILRTIDSGQFSISTSRPGVTRGNHYHNTKNEKFLVIKGEAILRFRHILSDEIIEYPVSDKKLEVVDIPTGYTHNITNTGIEDMVLILWANEQFDRENPDTYFLEV